MDVAIHSTPQLNEPVMIAAWPGMGYLAKISADYLRRRLKAELFGEITYYHNVLVYGKNGAELAPIKHRLYASEKDNVIICVGEAQPSTPEESMRLAFKIVEIAKDLNVKQIFTMAAYPNDVYDEPQVYAVYSDDSMKATLMDAGVEVLEEDGAVNGLNGVLIGVGKLAGITGVCLMGDITYANVPQHLSSKAVLEKLSEIIGLDIDTEQLRIRAKKIDASIKRRLDIYADEEEEEDPLVAEEKHLAYIS